jgi:endonuclease YncB( thermonuclease family)
MQIALHKGKNMKTLLVSALIVVVAATAAFAQKEKESVVYDYKITRVIDGDTVAFEAPFLPDPLKEELSIRVFGVDTPEKGHRAMCPKEAEMGAAASAFTKELVATSKTQQIAIMAWDKFGGRVLGDIILDGKSLRMSLIEKGYAREYYGEAKQSWCE